MRIEIKVYNTDIQNWILQGVEMIGRRFGTMISGEVNTL